MIAGRRAKIMLAVCHGLAALPAAVHGRVQQRPVVLPEPASPRASAAAGLVFEGVTVVDVRTGAVRPQQTLVVVGSRIRAVGRVGEVAVPTGARVVKAHGTFVIPGLWDMHVHPVERGRQWYPAFLAHGVTGIREMSTSVLDSVLQWRREIAAGTLAGPRVITPGSSLETPGTAAALNPTLSLPSLLPVATPADAGRIVDSLKRAGVDFIKPHGGFSREVYFALAAAARRAGLPFAGHLPGRVSPAEASDSGQRSIEHGVRCGTAAHKAGDTLAARAECQALADKFRRNGTWFSTGNPTFGLCALFETVPSSCAAQWARYMHPSEIVHKAQQPHPEGRSLETWAKWHTGERHYEPLQRAGIRFLAGTDAGPNPIFGALIAPGSLHEELWRLVRYGLTPLEALQAATLNPAEYFEATDSLGTIAPGQLADFVFLDADPLVDIYNTRRVRAVVANGRFYDRGELDALLGAGPAAASGPVAKEP